MLGKIKNVQLSEIWKDGNLDFTSWLSENLKDIGNAIGLELKFEAKEIPLGPFSVNILARDEKTNKVVVIVNQFDNTDYEHLGKFITYASVLDASAVIWIASSFKDEHKKGLDWLNDHTSDEIGFYGIKIELWQIGNSQPAARFNVISQPNSAVRQARLGQITETRKRRSDKELEANELEKSLDKANAIVKFDLNGKIASVNKLFCDMLEYEPDELIAKDFDILVPSPEMQKNFKDCLEESKKGTSQQKKFKTNTKSGKEKWIEASFLPIFDKEDKLIFILKIADDITEDVNYQKDLEKAKLEAEKALVAKDNFLCNMSHEIRTPLNAIIGFSDLLRKEKLNDTQFEHVDIILSAGENLLRIINDILDLSKIESGNFQLEKKLFSPAKVLKSVCKMQSEKASEKNIRLEEDIDDSVPEMVLGDEYRLTQIIINLVNNAIKFTHEGFVKISASAELQEDAHCLLLIKIQDSGIGIPEDKQQMIFERFTQADTDTTRKFGGTGLGLNIVKLLVNNFNGSLSLESKVGEGSVFSLSIPFKVEHESKEDKQEDISEYKLLQGKILMFEDNPLNQKLGQKIITELGHELVIVSNGVEGVEWLINNNGIDLILMDLQMPRMDGFEATSIIRNELKLKVPIIAMTAHSLSQEKAKCIDYGMNDFLSKPFKLYDLSKKIQTALSGKKSSVGSACELDEQKPDKLYDLKELKMLASGNKEFIYEMFDVFISETPEELMRIQNGIHNNDYKTIYQTCHKLKSSYDVIGYKNVFLLKKIEEMCQNGDSFEDIQTTFKKLKSETADIIEDLTEVLKLNK
ncbi:PAS domain-containing hybrid sensor histidine kinase/response regulator [Psychroflexus sediminis]|uniref:histidine kinase n=1 Tax=Psychroflexus sediminis TaxID=470826 RepID=A0A1G7XCD5_9FLAO|nr:ATP-binding protein [Psychroflexus sediminis]SDG81771.1 PAS domain S-box-containing protein [Psychroflexus sediminis]